MFVSGDTLLVTEGKSVWLDWRVGKKKRDARSIPLAGLHSRSWGSLETHTVCVRKRMFRLPIAHADAPEKLAGFAKHRELELIAARLSRLVPHRSAT